jgi:hypothetical protein
VRESYRASSERNKEDLFEPIWFHDQKVNHGSYFLRGCLNALELIVSWLKNVSEIS